MTTPTEPAPNHVNPSRLLLGLAIALACVAVVAALRGGSVGATGSAALTAVGEVTFIRRTPEGESPAAVVPIGAAATVLDATRAAGSEHGDAWHSTWRGDGQNAFLTSLGGEGSRPEAGLFWLFEVNGVESQVGAGVATLRPGDRVLWKLAAYE